MKADLMDGAIARGTDYRTVNVPSRTYAPQAENPALTREASGWEEKRVGPQHLGVALGNNPADALMEAASEVREPLRAQSHDHLTLANAM